MPAVYFGKQGKGIWKSKEEFSNPYNWSGYVVGQILSKPEYMGHTVNFRSHKQSYKDKNAVMNPKEDWLIFEDTHEAIVDRETWELAQKLRKTPKRIDTLGEAKPLTGLLYCADCGAKMYNQRSRGTESKPYPYDVFECSLTNWRVKNGLPLAVDIILYRVKRHKALAVRIAELTEDLEELRSEKALLLQKFEYAEDAGAEAFRKDIATMEAGLKKLETRE